MTYTAVPTKSTGDLWTAANHNTYIKDNFAAGVPDIFTTKGDIAVATAVDTATRLAVGTNDQILTADSSESCGIKWKSLSTITVAARYTVTTEQSISNTTTTIINFDNEDYDTDNAVTTGASWKFTVPADEGGYYLVTSYIQYDSSNDWTAGEYSWIALYKNNALAVYLDQYTNHATINNIMASASGSNIISLAAADYIDVRVYQNSGAAQTLTDTGDHCHIAIAKLF